MITRIVKLIIEEDKIEDFKEIFEKNQIHILNQDGCHHAEVFQDIQDPKVFFTYSKWENEDCLNKYRNSVLFESIWKRTKETFAGKPEAWSVK